MNLYHMTKFSPYFPFTLYCFHTKISIVEPILSSHPRGMAKSPLNTFVSHDRKRLSNSFNLRTRFCKTSTFEASHFNGIVKLWNYVCKLAPQPEIIPLHVDTSPYVPMPLVIYLIFCTNVCVLILFFFF